MDIIASPQELFYLSKVFTAHKTDVKDVVCTNPTSILTGSREGNIKLWTERAGIFNVTLEIKQRTNLHVNSLEFYKAVDGGWLIFAGLRDGTIEVFNSGNSLPVTTLRNHSQNVCTLFVDKERRLLLSGSWDARAVVWSIDNIISGVAEVGQEIVHHKHSVWAVITLPGEMLLYVTASADRTIQVHGSTFEELMTFTGHTDVVRSLVAISPTEFISSANDGKIRWWNISTAKCVRKYDTVAGEFIYKIEKIKHRSGKEFIVAGMERGFVEIFQLTDSGLSPVQNLRLPVSSVWSIAGYRSTDIAFGVSGGNVYVFTTDDNRKADPSILEGLDAELSALMVAEQVAQQSKKDEVVTIKVALDDGAPNMTLKYKKGENPAVAAERFIKENNIPISYLNEIIDYIKENVPESRLAEMTKYRRQETQRKMYRGEKYDYLFDVKLKQDGESLGLCYSIGEDPDFAAQRFVAEHDLPISFMPQLSQYLRTQVPELADVSGGGGFVRIGGQNVLSSADGSSGGGYVDPYTGAGRYIPGESKTLNGSSGDFLTSGDRYVLGQASASPGTYGKVDKMRPRSALVPMRQFYSFPLEGTSMKVISKLEEINEFIENEKKLSREQIDALKYLLTNTNAAANDLHISALKTALEWPMETLLPVLDILRVAVLNRELHGSFCDTPQTFERLLALLISDPSDNIRLLLCRVLVNFAAHEPGRRMLMTEISQIFKLVTNQLAYPKGNVQIAATSVLANCARLMLLETEAGQVKELGPREDALRAIIGATEMLSSFSDLNATSVQRLLQTIATLMWGDTTVIRLAKSRGVEQITNRIKDAVSDEAMKSLCRDIVEMIHGI